MWRALYFTNIFFSAVGVTVFFMLLGMLVPELFLIGVFLLGLTVFFSILETILLFSSGHSVKVERMIPPRLSNGDKNDIRVLISSRFNWPLVGEIHEELPDLLKIESLKLPFRCGKFQTVDLFYRIRPTVRGLYEWGDLNCFIQLFSLSLIKKLIKTKAEQHIPCYPSFLQFSKSSLNLYIENKDQNSQFIRKIGQSFEFEQIRDYATGDDYRHINWKASAKKAALMVNQYQEERSQDVYCAIDLGRTMQMPFNGMTLLDYSINACLALSKAIINRQDKAGLVTFSHQGCDILPPLSNWRQYGLINERLFNCSTDFKESDFENLYKFSRIHIRRRSLFILFTNFDSADAMKRSLMHLKSLGNHHLVLVLFFENSELTTILKQEARTSKDIYFHAIGYQRLHENKLITHELVKEGLLARNSKPENLSLEAVKSYLDIKRRQLF